MSVSVMSEWMATVPQDEGFPVAVSLLVVRHLVYGQRLCLTSQRHRGQIRMKP